MNAGTLAHNDGTVGTDFEYSKCRRRIENKR